MNLKLLRNIHLYLGVFFAPLLVFFLVSGAVQTFDLHERDNAPKFIQSFSEVHKHQRINCAESCPEPSTGFRFLVVLMVVGLLITTILGIVMAFKYTFPWIVWACLIAGVIAPFLLLLL